MSRREFTITWREKYLDCEIIQCTMFYMPNDFYYGCAHLNFCVQSNGTVRCVSRRKMRCGHTLVEKCSSTSNDPYIYIVGVINKTTVPTLLYVSPYVRLGRTYGTHIGVDVATVIFSMLSIDELRDLTYLIH
jgi:hypothetical protein